ncbi:hypothetical protein P8605_07820, partial [Streptomyces sp. T-3]|nr:hypothetical protein [Streptomyces sp. T-3]
MPAPVVAESGSRPLTETYQLLLRACESLRVEVLQPVSPRTGHGLPGPESIGDGEAGAWVDGAELAARPECLDAFFEGEVARIQQEFGHTPRTDVAASRLMHHYLWSVSLLMSGPWYLARRVPRVRPRDVRVHLATADLSFTPGGFACLADDPAAALPG